MKVPAKIGEEVVTRPVGWQELINPNLTRRSLLGGFVATPTILYADFANASESDWYDLEFELSTDQSELLVSEVRVAPSFNERSDGTRTGKVNSVQDRKTVCQWRIPAEAFGPDAFFDMAEPAEAEITATMPAPDRQFFVRNVRYGLRFGWVKRNSQSEATDASDLALKSGYVAFVFSRPGIRWQIRYLTDLWLHTGGEVGAILSSRPAEFRAFLGQKGEANHPLDLGAKSPSAPWETINTGRVNTTMRKVFGDLVGAIKPKTDTFFRVGIDANLVWRVQAIQGTRLVGQEGRVRIADFAFSWNEKMMVGSGRTALDPPTEPTKEAEPSKKEKPPIFFAGGSMGHTASLVGDTGIITLGAPDGHHVSVGHFDTEKIALDVYVGASAIVPGREEVVSLLSLGNGVLAVANGRDSFTDSIAISDLKFSQTIIRSPKDRKTRRSAIWGEATGAGPRIAAAATDAAAKPGFSEVATHIGHIKVEKSPLAATTHEQAAADHLSGYFQMAVGDRGGLTATTAFVLYDQKLDEKDAGALRRIHIDFTLKSIAAALPDASFSRLAFNNSDLRLVFEDGRPIDELPFGEYPRPMASSFIWLGATASSDRRAAFELSGAVLSCARDYDLMRLRLKFRDLLLVYEPEPVIRPAREDAQVRIGDDGAVDDDRPVLIAEFDPQHVLEEAVFRPEPPLLPDVELQAAVLVGTVLVGPEREKIIKVIEGAADEEAKIKIRQAVMTAKINLEEKAAATREDREGLIRDTLPRPFKKMAEEYRLKASGLEARDQHIYVGPFVLDPDAMGIARKIMQSVGPAAVARMYLDMLARVDQIAQELRRLDDSQKDETIRKRLLPITNDIPVDAALNNALSNEEIFAAQVPHYGVFRNFWREKMITFDNMTRRGMPEEKIREILGFAMPVGLDPQRRTGFTEHLSLGNRVKGYYSLTEIGALRTVVIDAFANFAVGNQDVPDLVSARLSGRSRLAFRINCETPAGVNAYDAGVEPSSNDGPARTAGGNSRHIAIPFTLHGLTDWSRFEPAVTKRARKLFEVLPSGLLPRPGSRPENATDLSMMRFQGFSAGAITSDQRMAEVRASVASQRISLAEDGHDKPFAGEPLDIETAIEIPARLILSTAQDAIWRTKRGVPPEIIDPSLNDTVPADIVQLEEGKELAGEESPSKRPRDLWSVRLETADDLSAERRAAAVALRFVASPDLRPSALGGYKGGDGDRLPGQGAPPRGPYAPWFIGPEQMDGQTLPQNAADCAAPPDKANKKYNLIRWLCERAGFRDDLPADKISLFRTSLDAFDRHQLVLLSSVYGLPVIGKREQAKGADPNDVDRAGGLISDSGQIEPGDNFTLIDARSDQAIHKPVPINVKDLSLTALGGSFLHETSFKPSAGADDYRGRKIFEGFSIDTLQQDIVLGRDITTEVVYKGYLLPMGHRASFVKLTERIFLRTPNQGIKAMLRQRMFLRMSERDKLYPALGQPHSGRAWCAKTVHLAVDKTPDLIDPTFQTGAWENGEDRNGRADLGNAPGLAFWPRTDVTDQGLFRFEITIDGTPTSLPMLFLDNIAATNRDSLKAAADHYNAELRKERRTLQMKGWKVNYASNSKAGEAQFETDSIVIRCQGRAMHVPTTNWTGMLEDTENFSTTGVLEGAGQAPFYPSMEYCTMRLGSVGRLTGGAPIQVEAQYDGHYVLYGFPGDPVRSDLPKPEGKKGNPQEIFLNLRRAVSMDVAGNGDRSGGLARPNAHLVAISRSKGPLGGDEATWWSAKPDDEPPSGPLTNNKGNPPAFGGSINPPGLVSLAACFNEIVKRPEINPAISTANASGDDNPPPFVAPEPPQNNEIANLLKQIQGFFSFDAKLLGTIRLKDLMTLLGLTGNSFPALKEALEFGTSASRELNNVANDIKDRVLSPLNDIVVQLRAAWQKIDQDLAKKQQEIGGVKATEILSLRSIYPEVDHGLEGVEKAVKKALAASDIISLIPTLSPLYQSTRELIRGLAVVSSNPVERLEVAVTANLQQRIEEVKSALTKFKGIEAPLDGLKTLFESGNVAKKIVDWIFQVVAGSGVDTAAAVAKIADLFAPAVKRPELLSVLKSVFPDADTKFKELWKEVEKIGTTLTSRVEGVLTASIRPALEGAVASLFSGGSVEGAVALYRKTLQDELDKAITEAKTSLQAVTAKLSNDLEKGAAIALADLLEAQIYNATSAAAAAYPLEFQNAVEAIDKLGKVVTLTKTTAAAVKGGKPEEILKAGGDLSEAVFGINLGDLRTRLRKEIEDNVLRSVRAGAEDVLAILPNLPKIDIAILREEIEACVDLKTAQTELPLPAGNDIKASSDLLKGIGEAIGALKQAQTALPQLDTAITKVSIPDGGLVKIQAFSKGLKVLVSNDGGSPDGLLQEFVKLYVELVRIQAAFLDLKFDDGEADATLDKARLERLGEISHRVERASKRIGASLSAITKLVGDFVAHDDNAAIIGTGAVLSGAITYAESLQISLSDELKDFRKKAEEWEKTVCDELLLVAATGLRFVGHSVLGAEAGIEKIEAGVAAVKKAADNLGFALKPEIETLQGALQDLRKTIHEFATPALPTTAPNFRGLLGLKVAGEQHWNGFFKPADKRSVFEATLDASRELEGKIVRELLALRRRIQGVPDALKVAAENAVVGGLFAPLYDGYVAVEELRNNLLNQVGSVLMLASVSRRALLVSPDARLGELNPTCRVDDLAVPINALKACDQLAQEVALAKAAKELSGITEADKRNQLRGRILAFFQNWKDGKAAPLLIVAQVGELAKDLLRGDILAALDLGAFLDQLEDAISSLIPTKINLSYDFTSVVTKDAGPNAIFQPKLGSEFGILVRAGIDLMTRKADYSASAHIGPFQIYLVGGIVDALKLKFGGAAFSTGNSTSARFDVLYEDFEIGEQLKFAKELQSFLSPKEGSGVFVQPMTRSAGIEAGYGLYLGTIGIGATSFFNVSLNVSAELPFGDEESLFKVSLGRRLAPFSMGVFPFVGSGYFSIYAAGDGIRGFEASFEYGGGAAIGFGPLQADCRVQVGVFVRVLKVNGQRKTEIYGTFFAGGSASIWIFHFSTSIYVRLGTTADGSMYGEAIYSFSFSLGFADYDYSITAYRQEKAIGSGNQQKSESDPGAQPTRFGAIEDFKQGIDYIVTGATPKNPEKVDPKAKKPTVAPPKTIKIKAASQSQDWKTYSAYFDTTALAGLVQ